MIIRDWGLGMGAEGWGFLELGGWMGKFALM